MDPIEDRVSLAESGAALSEQKPDQIQSGLENPDLIDVVEPDLEKPQSSRGIVDQAEERSSTQLNQSEEDSLPPGLASYLGKKDAQNDQEQAPSYSTTTREEGPAAFRVFSTGADQNTPEAKGPGVTESGAESFIKKQENLLKRGLDTLAKLRRQDKKEEIYEQKSAEAPSRLLEIESEDLHTFESQASAIEDSATRNE
jgi:hypothetical protein